MSVMPAHTMLTRADRDRMPDDGRRHELLDGVIVVTPSPGVDHQSVVMRLGVLLFHAAEESDLEVFSTAVDVVLSEYTVVVPDILVAPRDQFADKDLPGAPSLVVEVRSPSTANVDRVIKRDLYEKAGVPSYWLVDPREPSIIVLELVDGRFQQVARATGDETIEVTAPLPMTLTPSQWLRS